MICISIKCYNPENRNNHKRNMGLPKLILKDVGKFTYEEIITRDKTSLDIFWLKDNMLRDLDNLEPDDIAAENYWKHRGQYLNSFKDVLSSLQR